MFVLHSSNKTENLVAHLATVIASSPLSSPFEKEVFLIQSQGMERWLSQQLAGQFKVWGNYQFLFPNKFFSAMALKIDSRLDDSGFDRDVMLWRIEGLLRKFSWQRKSEQTLVVEDAFLPLKHYLSGENISLKRYQLARQLAQIFDQYQLMRPDMLDNWQVNRMLYDSNTEIWQKTLWLEVIAKLNAAEESAFKDSLPERISVFGMNTMPPLFLSYLQGLAKHCQIHLFLLNPAQSFWADLASKRKSVVDEVLAGHPLLSLFGQQGREFQEMLLEQTQFDFEPESFEAQDTPNNLQRLQNDILSNSPDGRNLQNDGSISIHACHSRMREVEVLRDQLLQCLEDDDKLELRDIVVMAPDIQRYEPYISAVFNDIQHAIADRSLRLSNRMLDAFISFLNLSQSRFGWRSVLDLLEQTAVYTAFGLNETDLELIKHWIQDTHVRWGQSAGHMQVFELPEISANTWQAMLDRLLMGYAVSNDKVFVDDILAYQDIEGASSSALGGLSTFMQLLFDAGNDLKQALTLKAWSSKLLDYSVRLLGSQDSNDYQQLNELLAELAAVENDLESHQVIEWQVIVAWLEDRVSERKSSKGFLRGQLTFCSMLPMRSIPVKVIALLGMNEGEFPKIDRPPTFDLLAHNFRKGDRSGRADDRYQFLEVLLSTRQRLIMTYIGQSISTNAAIPPSVVISEFIEVLRDSYQLADLIIQHPLQSFSSRYFEGTPALFSFSEADCEIAKSLATAKPDVTLWWQGEISPLTPAEKEADQVIELNDLFSFFQHPQRYFMRRQLDVSFSGIDEEPEEREPFFIDRLESYSIHHEWISEILKGSSISVKKLQAQGCWLPGALGELEYDLQQKAIESFVDRIKEKNLGQPLDSLPVDIKIKHYRLIGKLNNRYRDGSLFYRFADLKGKDFMNAWLHHLIINQLHEQPTYLMSTDNDLLIRPDYCRSNYLSGLIEIYLQGQQTPNAFFVEPALAYVQQACNMKSGRLATKSPLQAAVDKLTDAVVRSYEPELNRLYGNITDLGFILGESFEQQCQTLLLPVWEAMHGS